MMESVPCGDFDVNNPMEVVSLHLDNEDTEDGDDWFDGSIEVALGWSCWRHALVLALLLASHLGCSSRCNSRDVAEGRLEVAAISGEFRMQGSAEPLATAQADGFLNAAELRAQGQQAVLRLYGVLAPSGGAADLSLSLQGMLADPRDLEQGEETSFALGSGTGARAGSCGGPFQRGELRYVVTSATGGRAGGTELVTDDYQRRLELTVEGTAGTTCPIEVSVTFTFEQTAESWANQPTPCE